MPLKYFWDFYVFALKSLIQWNFLVVIFVIYLDTHLSELIVVKNLSSKVGDTGSVPGSGRSLEEEMATHYSILAFKIHGTEEPREDIVHGVTESDMTKHALSRRVHCSVAQTAF